MPPAHRRPQAPRPHAPAFPHRTPDVPGCAAAYRTPPRAAPPAKPSTAPPRTRGPVPAPRDAHHGAGAPVSRNETPAPKSPAHGNTPESSPRLHATVPHAPAKMPPDSFPPSHLSSVSCHGGIVSINGKTRKMHFTGQLQKTGISQLMLDYSKEAGRFSDDVVLHRPIRILARPISIMTYHLRISVNRIGDFGGKRPVISELSDHAFRFNPSTCSGGDHPSERSDAGHGFMYQLLGFWSSFFVFCAWILL